MPQVTPVFVDKIALTYDLDLDNVFVEFVHSLQRDGDLRIRYRRGRAQELGYQHGWTIPVEGQTTAELLICAAPFRGEHISFLYVSWNPRQVGRDAHEGLWLLLATLLGADFESFVFESTVTRLDLAVDVNPATVDSMLVYAPRVRLGYLLADEPEHLALDCTTGSRGRLQSIGLGSRRSSSSFVIYQRDARTRRRISDDPFVTRIEARIKPFVSLRELHSLAVANPFDELLMLEAVDPDQLEQAPDKVRLVAIAARQIGLQAALLSLKNQDERIRVRRWFEANLRLNWFDPNEVWMGMSEAIGVLQLSDFFGCPGFQIVQVDGECLRIRRRLIESPYASSLCSNRN